MLLGFFVRLDRSLEQSRLIVVFLVCFSVRSVRRREVDFYQEYSESTPHLVWHSWTELEIFCSSSNILIIQSVCPGNRRNCLSTRISCLIQSTSWCLIRSVRLRLLGQAVSDSFPEIHFARNNYPAFFLFGSSLLHRSRKAKSRVLQWNRARPCLVLPWESRGGWNITPPASILVYVTT